MISFKDYVNDRFDTHNDAIEFFRMSHTTFYRRLKNDNWKVIILEDGLKKEKHVVAMVYDVIKVEING